MSIARDAGTDLVFAKEAGVDHSSYFTRAEVSAKLLEWLPG